jgi:hypothetical protein
MARRIYKSGCLVEARNTKYEKGFGIILSGPHRSKYEWQKVPEFNVHWFERPSIVEVWHWNRDGKRAYQMTKNQIKAVRQKKS